MRLKTLTDNSYKKKKGVALRNKRKVHKNLKKWETKTATLQCRLNREERCPCGEKANKNKKGLRKCYNKKRPKEDQEGTKDNDWA